MKNSENRLSKIYENGDTEIYSYDNLYQLTKVETKDKTTEYNYDKVGNRMQMKILTANDTNITNYEYNIDNQLLYYNTNGGDTVSYSYDANGNQISETQTSTLNTQNFSYDYDDRLIKIILDNDTIAAEYEYGFDWRRLKKITGAAETKYFYDADDVLTEYDGSNNLIVSYTNNLGIDNIISAKRGDTVEYYHKDHLGSVVNLTDNSQLINQNYTYDVFGSILTQNNSNHPNNYAYTGREFNKESGLYYYRSRYYNSAVGRFIRKDDYKGKYNKPNTINKYIYTLNSSVNYKDPFGYYIFDYKSGSNSCCFWSSIYYLSDPYLKTITYTWEYDWTTIYSISVSIPTSNPLIQLSCNVDYQKKEQWKTEDVFTCVDELSEYIEICSNGNFVYNHSQSQNCTPVYIDYEIFGSRKTFKQRSYSCSLSSSTNLPGGASITVSGTPIEWISSGW